MARIEAEASSVTFFLLFGVLSWVWLVREMLRRDGFVDAPRWVCTGCAKGRMKPGCPVHDEELRKAS